jgi:hypothetical protein
MLQWFLQLFHTILSRNSVTQFCQLTSDLGAALLPVLSVEMQV